MATPTSSVSICLQRTTLEEAFVSVPVTADLIVLQPDETGRLDVPKLWERAMVMGQNSDVVWRIESQQVKAHPIQKPPPGVTGA
jgi:hypothetical protein